MIRWGVRRGLQALLALVFVALIAGQILGQPILLGFVETGSMEPTIETGDGFVAIPSDVAGQPEPGDVVVFEAQQLHGGGLTTHRIVEETDRGYVTRGDANPFPDQDGDEPYVQDEQIVAVAWQPSDEVVTVPSLGTGVMVTSNALESVQVRLATASGINSLHGTGGLAYLVLGLSIGLYVVETIRERRETSTKSRLARDDETERLNSRLLCATFALLVVVAAAGAMLVPAGTQSYGVVSAEFDSEQPLMIEQGTTEDVPYSVSNGGIVPIISYVEAGSDRVALDAERTAVGPRDTDDVTMSITAPEATGHYPTYVTEYRYLHVLPLPLIDVLYDVHPWVPFLAIVSLLGGGTYGLGRLLLGSADPRSRRKSVRDRGRKISRPFKRH